MLASLVRRAQLLELAFAALLVAALALRWNWPLPEAIVAAAGVSLGIRALLCALSFAAGWWFRSPRAGLGWAAFLGLVAREYRVWLRFNLLDLPWESWRVRPDPVPTRAPRPCVVLIHGYFANRGSFRTLASRLEAIGAGPVFTPNLSAFHADIARYANELHAFLEGLCAVTGQPVVLVAHSMGGLAARAYRARHGEARLARLVTIASPHHGTVLACLGQGPNAREMRRGSAFLAALERSEGERPVAIPALSIRTPHDNIVMPQATCELGWARNAVVPGEGHLSILESRELLALLEAEIRAASSSAG